MAVLSKFLMLLAIFLSASYANAFASLGHVAQNQVWVNHSIWFEESMSKPTNEQSRKLICEPTNDWINADQTTNEINEQTEVPLQ